MAEHKESCTWKKDFRLSVTRETTYGPDETLTVESAFVTLDDRNGTSITNFNFCPICGVKLS